MRPHLRMNGTSYRLDETYVEMNIEWRYLYRAVNSAGCIVEFMLSATRDAERMIEGIEAAHMMRKGQIKKMAGRDAVGQAQFVARLSGIAAQASTSARLTLPQTNLCSAADSTSEKSRQQMTFARGLLFGH